MLKTSPMLHRLSVASFTRICCRRMSSKPSLASPKFISVEGGDTHSSKSDGVNFSLVSYNILAQVYVKSSLFPHLHLLASSGSTGQRQL
ncbi:carbon catabolite repressor protein 4 homolog 4-like isoform X2 [Pistacia vera]|uniref:carbon catabolite repressor protein 4 homolog 4-like isoform X2 n=1 Tax=Pistacia vera TaxID=55513 RepID=UPI001263D86D|nr:carbon catabolite repressor protein 4 homolog 4-like isoform X2 [Pistacia vera]